MIIKAVLDVVVNLLMGLFSIMPNIPPLPEEVSDVFAWFIDTVNSVIGFINAIFPLQLALGLITFVIAVKQFKWVKGLLMWFIRKIPFLGIK